MVKGEDILLDINYKYDTTTRYSLRWSVILSYFIFLLKYHNSSKIIGEKNKHFPPCRELSQKLARASERIYLK